MKITDRKKDIIVNAGGDNISPSRIEAKLDIEPEISQSMLYGDFKNYLVAVIVPEKDFSMNWAKENSKNEDLKSIIEDESLEDTLQDSNLSKWQWLKKRQLWKMYSCNLAISKSLIWIN